MSLAIPVAGPGEVVVVIRGGTERFAAWADEPLGRNEKVLVTEQISARSVQVTPLLL